MRNSLYLGGGFCLILIAGCVERTLSIDSNPQGALIYLNDQEFGRSPVTRSFESNGNYDVIVRKEGFQTLKTTADVKAPWFEIVPLDLLAEILPIQFRDHQHLIFHLQEAPVVQGEAPALVDRANSMRQQLESGINSKSTTLPSRR